MANARAVTTPTDCDGGKSRLELYIEMVQAKNDTYYETMGFTFSDPPHVTANIGSKYARVVKVDQLNGSRSVHTFVHLDNGDIYKSGSWKAPAPNGVRGNIFDTDLGASVVNEFGANYLR
tara:strand:- start:93 stop:452 length:360 start_codon:yes stop_codon:yes gene_type:complete